MIPTDVTGLVLWLKADAGTYQDTAGTTPATADADPVALWQDQSGSANHAKATTSTRRPALRTAVLNSLPAIRGDGVDDMLDQINGATGLTLGTTYSMFLVYKPAAGASYQALIQESNSRGWFHSSSKLDNYYAFVDHFNTTALTNGTAYLMGQVCTTGSGTFYRNGAADGTFSSYPGETLHQLLDDAANEVFAGDLYEICVYSTALSTSDRQGLEDYFAARWGLTISRPTRFYFDASTAPAVTPASLSGNWDHTNSLYRKLNSPQGATTLADTAYTPDAADHLVTGDSHIVTFVSSPLAAQTISAQTVTVTARMLEANAANNLFLAWHVFLVNSSGTVGADLVAWTRTSASELGTALANRTAAATSTAQTVAAGDRICLSLGFGGVPTAAGGTQGHNGTIRWGESAASDLPADNTTTTDLNPWLEFAGQQLTFASGSTASGAWTSAAAAGSTLTGQATAGGAWASAAAGTPTVAGRLNLFGAWASAASSTPTATGSASASGAVSSAAASAATVTGQATATGAWGSAAASTPTVAGSLYVLSAWTSAAGADQTLTGQATAAGAWTSAAGAADALTGQATAEGSWDSAAGSSATLGGAAAAEGAWANAAASSASVTGTTGADVFGAWTSAAAGTASGTGAAAAAGAWGSPASSAASLTSAASAAGTWGSAAGSTSSVTGALAHFSAWTSAAVSLPDLTGQATAGGAWVSAAGSLATWLGQALLTGAWASAAAGAAVWGQARGPFFPSVRVYHLPAVPHRYGLPAVAHLAALPAIQRTYALPAVVHRYALPAVAHRFTLEADMSADALIYIDPQAKAAADILPYGVDATDWLGSAHLAAVTTTITGRNTALLKGGSGGQPTEPQLDDTLTRVTQWLSAGTPGYTYLLHFDLTDDATPARQIRASIRVEVR